MPELWHPRTKRRLVGALSERLPLFGRWIETPSPLVVYLHPAEKEKRARNLIVLLPGIQDLHHEFERAGFIAAARERKIDADLLTVDAHIGYYVRESILERLQEDVIRPAREGGYENVWIVGTSLGALGSALYLGRNGSDLSGAFLIAPYLGNRSLVDDIRCAGGPENWSRGEPVARCPSYQLELWRGLAKRLRERDSGPALYLGFGEDDKFAEANRLLASALPPERVLTVPGGHDWRVWAGLWTQFLDRLKESPHRL